MKQDRQDRRGPRANRRDPGSNDDADEPLETLIHKTEALVNLAEPLVSLSESLLNTVETRLYYVFDTIEALSNLYEGAFKVGKTSFEGRCTHGHSFLFSRCTAFIHDVKGPRQDLRRFLAG